MITVTFNELTHKVVPKEPTEEWHLKLAKGRCEWDTGLDVIADVIAAAPSYKSVEVNNMVWIPVSERLPELHTAVALLNINTWMNTGGDFDVNWCGCGWLCEFGHQYWNVIGEHGGRTMDSVTHWMPIPAAPKGEE